MNPIKAKTLYPVVAENLSMSAESVTKINSFFWKTVRTHLSDLVNPSILLTGLGTMEVKHWNIDKKVSTLTDKVNRVGKWESTKTSRPIFESYNQDLSTVTNLQRMVTNEEQRYQEHLKRLAQYKHEKEHHTNLES